jgi:hypothetical protein
MQGPGRGPTIWCIVRSLTMFLHKRLFPGLYKDSNTKMIKSAKERVDQGKWNVQKWEASKLNMKRHIHQK